MRRVATIDPRLSARITAVRPLVYSERADPDDDRPPHVRAASGLAVLDGQLVVVQDDASFLAMIDDQHVTAIPLPFGPGGRRRFEVALGNKLDKLDLESCVTVGNEVWAFGSGSLDVREYVVRLVGTQLAAPRVIDGGPMYRAIRAAVSGRDDDSLNIEGVAVCGDELWLCHRGNCSADDRPAIVRVDLAEVRAFLVEGSSIVPHIYGVDRYELGAIGGSVLGFTDAAARDARVWFVAAAEASPDAIADGAVAGSAIGVIDGDAVRMAPLVDRDGLPVKVEGLAFVGDRMLVTLDPDDPAQPTPLCEVVLDGPW